MGISKAEWELQKQVQKNQHDYLVAEIQKSEDYTIRVISEKLEPITTNITKLENDAKWVDRWLAALSVGWGAIAGWLFTTHGGKGTP